LSFSAPVEGQDDVVGLLLYLDIPGRVGPLLQAMASPGG